MSNGMSVMVRALNEYQDMETRVRELRESAHWAYALHCDTVHALIEENIELRRELAGLTKEN